MRAAGQGGEGGSIGKDSSHILFPGVLGLGGRDLTGRSSVWGSPVGRGGAQVLVTQV